MGKLNVKGIRELALSIVGAHPDGIRYGDLLAEIVRQYPETPKNTIGGSIWNLETLFPDKVSKPVRGLYTPTNREGNDGGGEPRPPGVVVKPIAVSEETFYEPFATWLKNDLGEATEAFPLGGSGLKTKWGTPDVIGVYKPLASNLVKFPLDLIAAEIKVDPSQPIVAFGQAVAYRLFAAKSYIAVPSNMLPEDHDRLESLCSLFGVGMVIFDPDPETPRFQIRTRAQRHAPDMFYVNEFAERLKKLDADMFEQLFR